MKLRRNVLIKEHPECPEVFCAISCRIGSPEILVVFTDRRLREPRFAEMCRNGLFT